MWPALLVTILAAGSWVAASGLLHLFQTERVRLPIVFWPPRLGGFPKNIFTSLATSVATSAAVSVANYASRTLAGTVRLPRLGYLNDSAIASAALSMRWQRITPEELEQMNEIDQKSDQRTYFVASPFPIHIDDAEDGIPMLLAQNLVAPSHATFIEAELITALSEPPRVCRRPFRLSHAAMASPAACAS
jgi:hypothetical protein